MNSDICVFYGAYLNLELTHIITKMRQQQMLHATQLQHDQLCERERGTLP